MARKQPSFRQVGLETSLIMGVLVTIFSEGLSLFHGLTWGNVSLAWLGVIIFCLYREIVSPQPFLIRPKQFLKTIQNQASSLWILIVGIIAFLMITAMIALISPPNNWDSMTYHMNRVVHWIQNRSVEHYPTYYLPQLFHPPWSSFAILQLQILTNSDRLANLVQWFSMVGSIVAVSLIAQQLQANIWGQILAAIFATTIPLAILESSSTQNDLVVSFWLLCFVFYTLLIVNRGITTRRLLAVSSSLGLAILTKTTAYFYALPFGLWLILWAVKYHRPKLFQFLGIAGLIIIGLNFPHGLRNWQLLGSFLGAPPAYQQEYKIEVISLPTFISNILRNLSIHLDIVRNLGLQSIITPITGIADKLIRIAHTLLGVNINDPRTTWPPNSFSVAGLSYDENTSSNPLHFFIILTAIGLFITNKKAIKLGNMGFYLIALTTGFLTLCLLLKWQPYHSRHHLFLFLSFAPFVGAVIAKNRPQPGLFALALALFLFSTPWLIYNKTRPIIAQQNILNTPRNEQYFNSRPSLKQPYLQALEFIRNQNCRKIGLSLEEFTFTSTTVPWEYPFWGISLQMPNQPKIEHIKLENISKNLLHKPPYPEFQPCAIIAFEPENTGLSNRQQFPYHQTNFPRQWFLNPITVYAPSKKP